MAPAWTWILIQTFTLVVLITPAATQNAKSVPQGELKNPPNILILMADDLGYGDIGCYGNTTLRTPNIDKLAKQGARMTQGLAAASLCAPSRTAFLTGRHHVRAGMSGSLNENRMNLVTASDAGMSASEITIAKLAKQKGYSTAILGKWHLGWSEYKTDPDHKHPLNQGFDYFYGIPLTLLREFDPREAKVWERQQPNFARGCLATCLATIVCTALLVKSGIVGRRGSTLAIILMVMVLLFIGQRFFILDNLALLNSFFFRNYDLVEQPIDLPSVTRKLVWEGEEFLEERGKDGRPFMLFVSWLHPHTPLATAKRFEGASKHGPYGDAVEELDWGVGRMLDALERLKLADNTIVYFTSDNGGHLEESDYMGRQAGGYNGIFKGGKANGAPDGGIRVPTILRWPGQVKAGLVTDEPTSLMDFFPTIARVLNAELPEGHTLDGRDLMPLMSGKTTVSQHEFLFHYCQSTVHAVRYRPKDEPTLKVWKLVMYEPAYQPGTQRCHFGCRCNDCIKLDPPRLFEMTSDPGEKQPLSPKDVKNYSEIVSKMLKALEDHEKSIVPVPCMLSTDRMLWRPWRQPVCNFPKFQCTDSKFTKLLEKEDE